MTTINTDTLIKEHLELFPLIKATFARNYMLSAHVNLATGKKLETANDFEYQGFYILSGCRVKYQNSLLFWADAQPDSESKERQWAEAFVKALDEEWIPIKLPMNLVERMNTDEDLGNKIADSLPHVSITQVGKIAYYPDEQKRKQGREVITTIGKYCRNFLGIEDQTTLLEIARDYELFTGSFSSSQVKFIANDDRAGWLDAYHKSAVKSCMRNPTYPECIAVYAAKSCGLEDNGLRLAYLGSEPSKAVARCIVNDFSRTYVRVYGDDRLSSALENLGYHRDSDALAGVKLGYITNSNDAVLAPYLDGDADYLTICGSGDNKHLLVDYDGDYEADNTTGLLSEDDFYCPCCGDRHECDSYDGEHSESVIAAYVGHPSSPTEHRLEVWCSSCVDNNSTYINDLYTRVSDQIVDEIFPRVYPHFDRYRLSETVLGLIARGNTEQSTTNILKEDSAFSKYHNDNVYIPDCRLVMDLDGNEDYVLQINAVYSEIRAHWILKEGCQEFTLQDGKIDYDFAANLVWFSDLHCFIHKTQSLEIKTEDGGVRYVFKENSEPKPIEAA